MSARFMVVVCAVALVGSLPAQQSSPSHSHAQAPLLYTLAPEYQPLAWLHGQERFPRGATVLLKDGNRTGSLVKGFFATADPNVSFDGESVLFSGKQHSSDRWQIWEVEGRSESSPRQITHCDDDCVRAMYLPSGQFVYARKSGGRFVLEVGSLDGTQPALQLTHAPGNFLPTDVLHDGRILFESGFPVGENRTSELYAVYPDGSGVEAYRCDHGKSRYSGRQVSSGDVIFSREGKLYRFTSAVAHEVAIPAPVADYAGDVIETASGSWLVSSRASRNGFLQLHAWKPGSSQLLPLVSNSKGSLVQPALLTARPVPNRFPSALHDWTYANVLCLNTYTSKEHIAGGSVASVRLYTRDAQGGSHAQGTAQVEQDGSFYLRVPGDKAIRIELLDPAGNTTKAEQGWFWLRSGEQRICVGCHAGPERAPDNAIPAVLQRSTTPADLTTDAVHSANSGGH